MNENELVNKVVKLIVKDVVKSLKLGYIIIDQIDSSNLNDDEKIKLCKALLKTYEDAKERHKKEVKNND